MATGKSQTPSTKELARRRAQREAATGAEAPQDAGYQELPSDTQATTAEGWAGAQGVALRLPSGNVCRVRASGFEALIAAGKIPNALMPIVTEALAGGTKQVDESKLFAELTADPGRLVELFKMYDDTVVYAVLEPRVLPVPVNTSEDGQPVPLDQREKVAGALYVDQIDQADKQAVWNYATRGTGELETFRS